MANTRGSSPNTRRPAEGVRAALVRAGAGDFLGAIVAWRQVATASPRDASVFRARPLFDRLLGFGSPSTPSKTRPVAHPPNDAWAALWAGDLPRARRLAENRDHHDEVEAAGIQGVADVLDREPARAMALLDHAIGYGDRAPRAVLRAHRLRALLHLRRFAEVHAALDQLNDGESFGVRVLRGLVQTQVADSENETLFWSRAHVDRHDFINGVFCRELPAVVGRETVDRAFASRDSMRVLLESVLDRLAGNLGMPPTIATTGADGSRSYVSLELPPTDRQRAVDALNLVRTGDPTQAERALDALVNDAPSSPTFPCYRGELRLWIGRYGDAGQDFATARERSPREPSRWGEIGGLAACMFEGRLADAKHLAEHPNPGLPPVHGGTLPVYRGALWRRLGDLDRAIEDLTTAVDAKSSRIGARMELCLALRSAGRASEATPHAAEILKVAAPLVVDAAQQLNLDWGNQPALLVGNETLEHALVAMRGNRSSSIFTWFDGNGRMRVLQSPESLKASAARELGALR